MAIDTGCQQYCPTSNTVTSASDVTTISTVSNKYSITNDTKLMIVTISQTLKQSQPQ